MIRRLMVLLLLVGGAVLLEPLRVPTEGVIAPRSLFLFGILLLTADTFGALAHDLKLPRLVGYLIAGLVLGPSVTRIVPAGVLEDLAMMKRLAVGLIGLLAGAELRITDLRDAPPDHSPGYWPSRSLAVLGQTSRDDPSCQVLDAVPFGPSQGPLFFVALLFATLLTVNSPMVTLAMLTETRASGPLAKTTLGVVLVADVLVILLFTGAFSLARGSLTGTVSGAAEALTRLLLEVMGSIGAGVFVGAVVSLYLRLVKRELVLFAVLVVFATAAAAQALHFELLLSLLVAGFLVENVAPVRAEPLVQALHQTAVPVFVIFFAMAGAELHLQEFAAVWPVGSSDRAGADRGHLGVDHPGRSPGRGGGGGGALRLDRVGVAGGGGARSGDHRGRPAIRGGTCDAGGDRRSDRLNESVGPILFRRGLERAGEVTRG